MKPPQVLFEDNHLLVVNKPAGLPTMGAGDDVPTLARQAAAYLKRKYNKPGNVYVGVVSRLDSLVSGVLVLARTSKAASRLSAQLRERTTRKRYLAIVEGQLLGQNSTWRQIDDFVAKNEGHQRMEVVPESHPGAQSASLRVRGLASMAGNSLIEVDLLTGRKHQIRVQLAAAGHAVVGDHKYGSQRRFIEGIALHCFELTVEHPTLRKPMTFTCYPRNWETAAPELLKRGLVALERQG